MALGNSKALAARLGLTEPDSALEASVSVARQLVLTYLNFNPETTSITEYLSTRGTVEVTLSRWPVSAVASVYEDRLANYGDAPNAFAAATLLTLGTDYSLVRNDQNVITGLRRIGAKWPYSTERGPGDLTGLMTECPGCVKVAYTVDNTAVLAVANEAVYVEATARYFSQKPGIGTITSDGMDGASVTISPAQRGQQRKDEADTFVSPFVAQMLIPFRRRRFL